MGEVPLEEPPGFVPADDVILDAEREARVVAPPKSRRRMFRQLGCSVRGYAPICMDSNDPDTIKAGVLKRVLRDTPAPNPATLARLRLFCRNWARANLPKVTPLGLEEWLDGTSYNEARKTELRKCASELRGGRPNRAQCRKVKSFGKTEHYLEYKHLRLINSRSDHFKTFAGPRFKAVENVVYALPQFAKHIPVQDRPAAVASLRQAGLRYFATDFTAFESHFVPEIMQAIEFEVYRHCLSEDEHLEYMLRAISSSNAMRTGSVLSTCRARRMSGEANTSLGNGLTNWLLAAFLAEENAGSIHGLVEGDDGIFACDFELTAAMYADLGFTIKIEEKRDPCAASFCGMVFSDSGEIIRDPRKFLMGFGWTSSFINAGPKIMNELLRAKALSAVYETPQCPIVGALARLALEETRGSAARFVDDGFHKVPRDAVNLPDFQPSHDTRALFAELYNVTVEEQLVIEGLIYSRRLDCIADVMHPGADSRHYECRYVETT